MAQLSCLDSHLSLWATCSAGICLKPKRMSSSLPITFHTAWLLFSWPRFIVSLKKVVDVKQFVKQPESECAPCSPLFLALCWSGMFPISVHYYQNKWISSLLHCTSLKTGLYCDPVTPDHVPLMCVLYYVSRCHITHRLFILCIVIIIVHYMPFTNHSSVVYRYNGIVFLVRLMWVMSSLLSRLTVTSQQHMMKMKMMSRNEGQPPAVIRCSSSGTCHRKSPLICFLITHTCIERDTPRS